MAGAGNRT